MKYSHVAIALIFAGAAYAPVHADIVLEPFSYHQDFETQELSAWASYPLWQDTAYDPNIRVNTIVPGNPNISLVQIVTPYTNVDNYAGAQKKLDMYLVPGSSVTLRYYLKTNLNPEFLKIRLGAGPDKKVDFTVSNPPANRWEWLTVTFSDFIRENPRLAGRDRIGVNALAVLAKFPKADPKMPIYFGLDDVTVKGARDMAFQFSEPSMFKLSEWKPYIAGRHYRKGDTFSLRGAWPLDPLRQSDSATSASRISLDVCLWADETKKSLFSSDLKKQGNEWGTSFKLTFPQGLYHATLKAFRDGDTLSEMEFTFVIAPESIGGKHPRLWFDAEKMKRIDARLKSDRFKWVLDDIVSRANDGRSRNPVEKVVFDIDQFPDEDWIPTLSSWSTARIHVWRSAVFYNSLAYAFTGDREAGIYAKDLMLTISKFPYWLHPWMIKRGQHIYYPIGELGMDLAIGYDLVYDLMDENERAMVRSALMKNVVLGCHKGYVEDNLVTSTSSNWVAHITGGSLMCQAAMYGDGPDVAQIEPYFTGAVFKDYELVQHAVDRDGAYGEGYGYYAFTMFSWAQSLPALENIFNIDFSAARINHSYDETIWAGIIKEKKTFYFGDSDENLEQPDNWAWLLVKYRDPLLGWFYNFTRAKENSSRERPLYDVIYETEDVPKKDPFGENPVRVFRDVGTTVFKSGWEPDDFVFVMRTGPFVNHQHIDQGTFWLSDRGSLFVSERHGSSYYTDPLYQSHYTQPIGHSTILIDGNHQSQRTGDLLTNVDGFDDYAFIYEFLDGKDAAFTSGDIGRLYWGKVQCLRRNVLYLKPRTLLMLDTVVPAGNDVDVTLLYQVPFLKYINAGSDLSHVTIDGNVLNVMHLYPHERDVKAVETPHYLSALRSQKPLEREGMLTVTARTAGVPLVIANMLTTTTGGKPDISVEEEGVGFITGKANGQPFIFSTRPGTLYERGNFKTDALAIYLSADASFVAFSTTFEKDDGFFVRSDKPLTFETSSDGSTNANVIKFCAGEESVVKVGVSAPFDTVEVNGKKLDSSAFDTNRRAVAFTVPKGAGEIRFEIGKGLYKR